MSGEKNTLEFFNFWNAQTFHFYQWVMHSGKVPVDALIDRAWEMLEEEISEDRAAISRMDIDVSCHLCEKLVSLLKEIMETAASEYFESHTDYWFCECEDNGIGQYSGLEQMGDDQIEGLFLPILIEALSDIEFGVVAAAILIANGRWEDEDVPEMDASNSQ